MPRQVFTKEDAARILAEVMENKEKLESCPTSHKFTIPAGRRKFVDDFLCEVCGGRVSLQEKHWYEKGLEHGRREFSQ